MKLRSNEPFWLVKNGLINSYPSLKEDLTADILIVGSGSNVPGLGEFFTNELVMPARVASPWQALDFAHIAQPAKHLRARLATAAGLALVDPKEAVK